MIVELARVKCTSGQQWGNSEGLSWALCLGQAVSVAASTGVPPALAPTWAVGVPWAGTHGPAHTFGIAWGHSSSLMKSTWRMNDACFGHLCPPFWWFLLLLRSRVATEVQTETANFPLVTQVSVWGERGLGHTLGQMGSCPFCQTTANIRTLWIWWIQEWFNQDRSQC